MTTDGLPDLIESYQRAHDRRDTDTALGAFASDATRFVLGDDDPIRQLDIAP